MFIFIRFLSSGPDMPPRFCSSLKESHASQKVRILWKTFKTFEVFTVFTITTTFTLCKNVNYKQNKFPLNRLRPDSLPNETTKL